MAQQNPEIRDWQDYFNFFDAINDWSPKSVLEFHGPEGVALYRGTRDQISDPTMELVSPDGLGEVPAYRGRAHIVFQRFELADFGNRIPNLTFEVVQSDDARIRPVLTDLMERSGLEERYYDLSALPEEGIPSYVLGYSIGTITSYRAAMEPLLEAFKIDAAEIGNEIIFRPKVRPFDHAIDYNEVAAIEAGSNPETPIKLTLRDVIDMPRSLGIRYRDPEREYQQNTATFTRQVTPSKGNSMIELPAVLAPSVMKEFVRDKMRDVWLERNSGAFTVPHRYAYFSPSDIIYINGADYGKEDVVFKLTSVTRRDTGILELEGVLRETTLYEPREDDTNSSGVDRSTFSPQRRPQFSVISKFQHLNLPALLPSHNDAGFYYAVSGSRTAWPGAGVWLDIGPTIPFWQLQENLYIGAVIGRTRNSFLLPVMSAEVVDYDSEVFVFLYNRDEELESITGEQLFAGGNPAVIGDEIVNFKDASRQSDGSWRLSTFLRGRRGTQGATNSHARSGRFTFLDANEINNNVRTLEEAFNPTVPSSPEERYQAVTFGGTLGTLQSGAVKITRNTTQRLIPFAPVRNRVVYDSGGDITLSWVRQDRLAFTISSLEGDTVNSEETETYFVQIEIGILIAPPAPVEILYREFTVTDATQVVYTSAMQAEDGIVSGRSLDYTIAQVSATVGAGATTGGIINVR